MSYLRSRAAHPMTTDPTSITYLRNRIAQGDVAIAAFEREHSAISSTNPEVREEYVRLLRFNADAKSALRCAVAEKHGEYSLPLFAAYGC